MKLKIWNFERKPRYSLWR